MIRHERFVDRYFVGILRHAETVVRKQIAEHGACLFCALVLKHCSSECGTRVFFFLFVARKKHPAFDKHEFARHYDKIRRKLYIKRLRLCKILHVLVAYEGYRDIVYVDFVF